MKMKKFQCEEIWYKCWAGQIWSHPCIKILSVQKVCLGEHACACASRYSVWVFPFFNGTIFLRDEGCNLLDVIFTSMLELLNSEKRPEFATSRTVGSLGLMLFGWQKYTALSADGLSAVPWCREVLGLPAFPPAISGHAAGPWCRNGSRSGSLYSAACWIFLWLTMELQKLLLLFCLCVCAYWQDLYNVLLEDL